MEASHIQSCRVESAFSRSSQVRSGAMIVLVPLNRKQQRRVKRRERGRASFVHVAINWCLKQLVVQVRMKMGVTMIAFSFFDNNNNYVRVKG